MPNGKPGDHPYTDIVVHGSSAEFGREISEFVRSMAVHPGFFAIRDDVAKVLQECSPYWQKEDRLELLSKAKQRLEKLAANLKPKTS